MGKRQTPLKVCLTNRGKDTETPWAEDLGPAPASAPPGSRLVCLVNVPFLHAKPTWGDTVVVTPDPAGILTWDRNNTAFGKVDSRIHEDGGRWAMIVDYAPHPDSPDADRTYSVLARACAELDVVCEVAWGPRDGEPGRAYLAVKSALSDAQLMKSLRAAELPCELIQIHPAPKAAKTKPAATTKPAVTKAAVTKPVATKPAVTKPVATKPAATKPAAKKPAVKKPAVKKPAPKPAAPKQAATKPAATKPPARKKR